ncbi:MAG: T9SS type A sorting domain-containing protein [Bacteroidales bacterium]|jgi:hypothetical protein|nr:T9SS type A sorting domain-containing protein [Bacteroidales bacterium]
MKRILFTALFVALLGVINAQQLPNSSFESWSGGKPTGWNTLDIQIPDDYPYVGGQVMDLGTNSITKSTTDYYSGSAAMKVSVSPMNDVLKMGLAFLPDSLAALRELGNRPIPGVATNGHVDLMALVPVLSSLMGGNISDTLIASLGLAVTGGTTITQKPVALFGVAKTTIGHDGDMMVVVTLVYTGTESTRKVMGYGVALLDSSETFKSFEAEITCTDETPTEIVVLVAGFSTETVAAEPYSYTIVDELNLSYGAGIANNKLSEVSMYPNPAKEVLNIRTSATEYDVQIVDMLGRVVIAEKSSPAIHISSLTKGVYFVKVTQNGTTHTNKIVVE